MSIKLELPKLTDLKPRITVIGVGGAGGNAVNNMISSGLGGVEFVVANTDAQALLTSSAEQRVQLGVNLTEGLGAGSRPEIGEAAAEEALDELRSQISGSHMVFIACGMGGGTGTGAAAVIARIARELDALTVGVVTKPFQFEGTRRMRVAEAGIEELKKYVDTLIVIPNQNLFRIASEKTTFAEAFILADQVLYSGIACIVDLIIKEGLINLDFADVRVVMAGMGSAVMGTGEGEGERRAVIAAEEAISNPLLDGLTLSGAKGLLLSIVGGNDLTLYEVDEAASRVRQEVDADANIIVGASFDEGLEDRVRVSIVASGMDRLSDDEKDERLARKGDSVADALSEGGGSVFDGARTGKSAAGKRSVQRPQSVGNLFQRLAGRDVAPEADMDAARETIQAPVSGSRPEPDPRSEMEAESASAPEPAPPQPGSANDAATQPMAWQAPGEVLIEETTPQLTPAASAPAPPPIPLSRQEKLEQQQGFSPARPEDVGRPSIRMPAVEEFPVVAQRDYHAKTGQRQVPTTAPTSLPPLQQQQLPSPPPGGTRKPSFFQRLTGRAGQTAEAAAPTNQTGIPTSRSQAYPQPDGGRPGGGKAGLAAEKPGEDVELPVFFGRGKR